MEWLSSHSSAISAISSVCTLLVWLFYAQLLYLNFRRQRQPKVIINRGGDRDLKAHCVISNMSPESIFVEHIIAFIDTKEGSYSANLIDTKDTETSDDSSPPLVKATRQGPMASGSFDRIGTFEDIIQYVMQLHGLCNKGDALSNESMPIAIELRVIAIYGSEDAPIGSVRRFEIKQEEESYSLTPVTLDTRRYASRRSRHQVRQWMRDLEHGSPDP